MSGENASFSFTITNLSDKEIKEFTLVLNLIDEEGASAFISGQASFPFSKNIPSWEDFSTILNFECFLASEDTFFEKDYIYIERIVYEDGSVWEDFLGRYAR